MNRRHLALFGVATALIGCSPSTPGPTATAPPVVDEASPELAESATPPPPPAGSADLIFVNTNLITMDEAQPRAEAIAIEGETILAVGSRDEIMTQQGPDTLVIDLEGRTVTPGFIDAHQHRIGNRGLLGIENASDVIDPAVAQGLTTIGELYVDEARLEELLLLDEVGDLKLRVNAYLPVQANSPDGELFEPYYNQYSPGQQISPHVRVAGLKVFTDFDNASILLWQQDALNEFLLIRHQEGWQLAVKTVSTRSLEMILIAFEHMQSVDPGVAAARGRLEHALSIAPAQIDRVGALGLVPIINLNVPGQIIGDTETEAFLASEPEGAVAPWRSLAESEIPVASGSGWPSYYVDEPGGAPFGSPVHLIYQAVTRVGNLGTQPHDWMLDEAISAEQAMRAMTIDAAYASFQEESLGSLTAGKLADLVVLSDDPLSVDDAAINDIEVVLTIIGGEVVFCQPGLERLCYPVDSEASPPQPESPIVYPLVIASASLPGSGPELVLDGSLEASWNSGGDAEQWIQIDLGSTKPVEGINLHIAQYPDGETVHELWAGPAEDQLTLLETFASFTRDSDILSYTPDSPLAGVRIVRVVTTQSPSWVAWQEIEIVLAPE